MHETYPLIGNSILIVHTHMHDIYVHVCMHYSVVCSDNADEGYAMIKDLAPNTAQEYILKAVALTVVGQEHGSVSCRSGC